MNSHFQAPVQAYASIYHRMRSELLESFDLEPDDPALLDTLDGATELGDVLAAMARRMRELELHGAALRDYERSIGDRRAAKLARVERIRRAIQHTMEEVGMPRLERPDLTLSFRRNPPSLIVSEDVDPASLPKRFVRIRREINRTALRSALQDGETIPGVSLSNPSRSLQVR